MTLEKLLSLKPKLIRKSSSLLRMYYSLEASRFFRCPYLNFELNNDSTDEPVTKNFKLRGTSLETNYSISVGGCFKHVGDRNIITLNGFNSLSSIISHTRHEIAHGYHYRFNNSFKKTYEEIFHKENYDDWKIAVAEKTNQIVELIVSSEAIAYAYQNIRMPIDLSFEFSTLMLKINPIGLLYPTDHRDLFVARKDAINSMSLDSLIAQQLIVPFAYKSLFIDNAREPVFELKEIEGEKIVKATYHPLPLKVAKQNIREGFRKDCKEFAIELINGISDYFRCAYEYARTNNILSEITS